MMAGATRIVLALVAGLVAYVAGYWLPGALLPDGWQNLSGGLVALSTAAAVWAGAGSRAALARGAVRGAAWGGAIGFIGGFFGPMIFAPDANQGPLLGLFITGPGGVVIGGLCGALIAAGKPG